MVSEIRKVRWSEAEILDLPLGEHDYFERKSGALIDNSDFVQDLAKALSAFANSGGGHIILGVKDNGEIDGVPLIKKGRVKTRDWLEQKIPDLLNYPLQNFRVHEVESASPTTIPKDKVVIVIDVGDSDLAPHQCDHNKVYYYRAGGRSEPAPHFYLQVLSRREVYPGPAIARAWLDTVINPLLTQLQDEKEYLRRCKWTWEVMGKSLKELRPICHLNDTDLVLNLEQILESHLTLIGLIKGHDGTIIYIYKRVEGLFEEVKSSPELSRIYSEITSSEALDTIKKKYPHRLSHHGSDAELLRSFSFDPDDQSQGLAWLAQEIVNRAGELTENISYQPLWNTYRDKLITLLMLPRFQAGINSIEDAKVNFLKVTEQLMQELKIIRQDLATRFRIPYSIGEQLQQHGNRFPWPR